MRSGKCPKCGSTEIFQSHDPQTGGGIGWGESPEYLRVLAKWGATMTKKWETFLCGNCGYFENYIMDREILDVFLHDPEYHWVKVDG
jgi:predicted nucleic-acid-binding Zn-ribbon protein